MILGAYLAGLFFEEKVAHPNLVKVVTDRAYGIAYSFLGPIFFISLGFSITFDIAAAQVGMVLLLTTIVIVGQSASAGSMALRMGLPKWEALTVGVGMCGRAEMAFILASLALSQGAFDQTIFTMLIMTTFLLNLFTPLALKGCAMLLQGTAARQEGATRGVVQIDKFNTPLVEARQNCLRFSLVVWCAATPSKHRSVSARTAPSDQYPVLRNWLIRDSVDETRQPTRSSGDDADLCCRPCR